MEELRQRMCPFLIPHLSEANIQGRAHGNRRPLTVDEKLGIGLMTAGGCPLGGILHSFHVGRTCALTTITQFFEAVILSRVGEIRFPSTIAELQSAADAFLPKPSFCNLLYGHVGALDGLAVRIPIPKRTETDNPLGFVTRKGFAAVNAQAIADAKEKCIFLAVQTEGSTHDSTAWGVTQLAKEWKRKLIVDPRTGRVFWISDDEAYAAGINEVCPWPGTGLITREIFKDAFNYYLSRGCHNIIERLFGQVHQRFGILWRPILFPLRKVPIIVMAVFQLHNFLKEMKEENAPSVGSGLGALRHDELQRSINTVDGYDHDYHTADSCCRDTGVTLPRVRQGQCPVREEITLALRNYLMVRPPTASHAHVI